MQIRRISGIEKADDALRAILARSDWWRDAEIAEVLRPLLTRLVARYLLRERRRGRSADPVAHFHLSNGARLEQINWLGDRTDNGMKQSAGIMVNYLYRLDHIDQNHEDYRSDGTVHAASRVRRLDR